MQRRKPQAVEQTRIHLLSPETEGGRGCVQEEAAGLGAGQARLIQNAAQGSRRRDHCDFLWGHTLPNSHRALLSHTWKTPRFLFSLITFTYVIGGCVGVTCRSAQMEVRGKSSPSIMWGNPWVSKPPDTQANGRGECESPEEGMV